MYNSRRVVSRRLTDGDGAEFGPKCGGYLASSNTPVMYVKLHSPSRLNASMIAMRVCTESITDDARPGESTRLTWKFHNTSVTRTGQAGELGEALPLPKYRPIY